jgi:1-pyrroline-5-carboxylate dehydrogenase
MTTSVLSTSIQPRTPEGVFANEPFVDFKAPVNERAIRGALERVGLELGREYSLIIGGERLKTSEKIRSLNPANPSQVVGVHQKAGAEHAEKAMAAALRAFEFWSRASTADRVSLLLNAAALIRERKFDFMAWLTYEVGKNWAEADADVARRSTFWSSMRARRCGWRGRPRRSSIPASGMSYFTFRWAWAR